MIVLCAHGTRSTAGQEAVASLVSAVAKVSTEEVAPAFVDVHGPFLADVVTDGAVVVPLLLAAGYHVNVDIADAVSALPSAVAAPALGPDRRITSLLVDRLEYAGATPDDVVFLAAAGSSDDAAHESVVAAARDLSARWGAPVTVAYGASRDPSLSDEVARLRAAAPGRRIVAASYLLATGHFHERVLDCGADLVTDPLVTTSVDDRLVDLVLERALSRRVAAFAR